MSISLDEYQELAGVTDGQAVKTLDRKLYYYVASLCGESGEVAELVKKFLDHGHGMDKLKLTKELGDVLWSVARLAAALDIPLSSVADENIAKLRSRYGDKFTEHASKNRAPGDT